MAVHHRSRGFPRPPPPPETKVTLVGKNKSYNRENLVGPFWGHNTLVLQMPWA